ncbi:urea ABC transporter ATP-binding subunit UrtE [Pseudoroseomonas wenyumeiae]|uniref:Urea ABC transporter ATP-binding subunit UrtE n=1 Tax=Teichococcus wenyumeiae TaxID=2478470 RepID=A0A3A9JBW5_9PROT|nr:urea ABC transporter ATP-binding subunit UrtE [Pseudoroseomonas wenyumeiae]RKK02055.1 urea ABC transporter ATP-binding subunit UrtE [Pseudoroseomonas wenyumeiae]RMI25273.1 urea ABC transporter ATP-binding subunit UrtE [Pseudoroseomonas wenyumeiae]
MLRVEGIDLFYGASRALRGVSLGADPGRITCVLGRNGVGKSSLMRAIVGLERIRGGRIVWEGRDISGLAAADRARAGIGYVPQGREIFPFLTVKENLETALAAAPRGSKLTDDIFELFPILKQFLRRRGGDLSGGQQQQLAIARALTARPRLLILDEPTEGIQPNVIKDIARVIALLARQRNMAVVLVEQYYEFARELGDELAILVRGEVALAGQSGTLDEEAVRRLLTV